EQNLIAEIEQKKARIIADTHREKELIEAQADADYKTLTYKICVFGNSRVGKTTLIDRFLTNTFHDDLKSTLGATIHVKKFELEKGKITLQVWDFGGEEKFRFLIKPYFRGSAGGIFAFDLTNYESLINMVNWVPEFKKICRDAPIIMAGCKLDLEKERICQKEEALALMKLHKVYNYIECSSKTGENTETVFRDLLKDILKSAGYSHLKLK
ncbi:MAG: Rab family GTPase, partial [Candidatus Lokiarchaeia archaeon]|nr:Rab family GTPase [Candidatus Lokiarchaeia archaeon]